MPYSFGTQALFLRLSREGVKKPNAGWHSVSQNLGF
jgi:hypothetical protein